tara:strand:+ start:3010 stop:3243 length:234 start_codon:yes stop_codon:yes gene_type:complete
MDKVNLNKKRHIAKTITWRIVASTDTLLIAWVLTGSWKLGGGIAIIEIVTKMVLYYFHERIWYSSSWGVTRPRIEQD